MADDSGTSGALIAGGIDTRPGLEGQPFGGAFVFGGGWGGTSKADGISFCQSSLYNCRAVIVEYTEKSAPIVIWEHARAIDSAGAGENRGGFGAVWSIEALSDTYCTPIVDSSKFAAEGVEGGGGGATSWGALVTKHDDGGVRAWNGVVPVKRLTPLFGAFDEQGRPDPDAEWGRNTLLQTSKPTAYLLKAGEILRIQIACAAGYGDPLAREAERVLDDVTAELVSITQAADVYGVRIASDGGHLTLDAEGTRELREQLAAGRDDGQVNTPLAFFRQWPLDDAELSALANNAIPMEV